MSWPTAAGSRRDGPGCCGSTATCSKIAPRLTPGHLPGLASGRAGRCLLRRLGRGSCSSARPSSAGQLPPGGRNYFRVLYGRLCEACPWPRSLGRLGYAPPGRPFLRGTARKRWPGGWRNWSATTCAATAPPRMRTASSSSNGDSSADLTHSGGWKRPCAGPTRERCSLSAVGRLPLTCCARSNRRPAELGPESYLLHTTMSSGL